MMPPLPLAGGCTMSQPQQENLTQFIMPPFNFLNSKNNASSATGIFQRQLYWLFVRTQTVTKAKF
jgi:hypothetical protein